MTKASRKLRALLESHGIRQDVTRLLKQHQQQLQEQKTVIDLHGPNGNAFVIIATAQNLARKMGWSNEQINSLLDDMRSGDYMNLIDIFEENFGDFVILKNRPSYRDNNTNDDADDVYEGYQQPGDPGNWIDRVIDALKAAAIPFAAIITILGALVAQGYMGQQDLKDRIEHHHLKETRKQPRKRKI